MSETANQPAQDQGYLEQVEVVLEKGLGAPRSGKAEQDLARKHAVGCVVDVHQRRSGLLWSACYVQRHRRHVGDDGQRHCVPESRIAQIGFRPELEHRVPVHVLLLLPQQRRFRGGGGRPFGLGRPRVPLGLRAVLLRFALVAAPDLLERVDHHGHEEAEHNEVGHERDQDEVDPGEDVGVGLALQRVVEHVVGAVDERGLGEREQRPANVVEVLEPVVLAAAADRASDPRPLQIRGANALPSPPAWLVVRATRAPAAPTPLGAERPATHKLDVDPGRRRA